MNRRDFVVTGLVVAVAGCLGSDGDGESDQPDDGEQQSGETEPEPPEIVVQQFYQDLDENPDPDRIAELFHSQSPSASYWRGVFVDAQADRGAEILDTSTTLAVEDAGQADVEAYLGFALDDEVVATVVDVVEAAPEAAIVEADLTIQPAGEDATQTERTDTRVLATENGEWQLVW